MAARLMLLLLLAATPIGESHEPLVSMQHVADFLDVPLETVRWWRKRRKGPQGYRVGREMKFRMSEVEAWLQSKREQQAS